MPKVTVYIRNEDYALWREIEEKTEFIHQALGSPRTSDEKITIVPSDFKNSKITRLDNGTCTLHGMPLTVYGKCLVKGCKNG